MGKYTVQWRQSCDKELDYDGSREFANYKDAEAFGDRVFTYPQNIQVVVRIVRNADNRCVRSYVFPSYKLAEV